MEEADLKRQLDAANSLIRTYREEWKGLKRQTVELQAALAAKDYALAAMIDYARAENKGLLIADEALAIKPSDAELRKLVAKHVRKAFEYRMTYASEIEDGSAEL